MADSCYFSYQARRADGTIVSGISEAVDAVQLTERLRTVNNLELTRCRRQRRGKKLALRQSVDFMFNLRHSLAAGVPLLETLTAQASGKGEVAAVASRLASQIEAGSSLADAMAGSGMFDKLSVALVDCGESAGAVVPVLDGIIESMQHRDELTSQLKRGLVQPLAGAVAVLAVIISMSVWVVPGLTSFLQSMGQPLPQHTKVLLQLLQAPLALWQLWLALALLLPGAWYLLRQNANSSCYLDKLLLSLPVFGKLCMAASLARVTAVLRLLYNAGMSLPDAMDKACSCVSNNYLLYVLRHTARGMREGLSLVAAMRACGLAQPMLLRILAAGENAGTLDVAFGQLCHIYTRDLRETAARISVLMTPVMTLILGLLLAWSALAFIAPIYELVAELPL